MSTNNTRQVSLVIAFITAVTTLFFAITSVSFAAGGGDTDRPTVCVSGFVINHRENPVDGTKFDPPLMIHVEGVESPELTSSVIVSDTVAVAADGSYSFTDLPAGLYYNFTMQLPPDWDGIVPAAPRNGVAESGYTLLNERKGCHDVLFKIRRWFDVTVLKWEELQNGAVQPGNG
ncbi:MAG: hypothetical protein IAE85_07600, partial [Anaerolinea sp.]|nr:hypothetical protein [Anaerolinea sp.]